MKELELNKFCFLLTEEERNAGSLSFENGYRTRERTKGKKEKQKKIKYKKEEILKLIERTILASNVDYFTKESFARVLKTDEGTIAWCFQELNKKGILYQAEHNIAHDCWTSNKKDKRSSGWCADSYRKKGTK